MEFKAAEMSADEDKEPEYVNFQRPPAPRHNRVCSGRRVKVAVLTVSVVSSVALIVAAVVVFFPRCPPSLYCDVGWKLNATNCYYFSTLKLSWNQSRTKCQDASGDLVKIESREEQVEGRLNSNFDQEPQPRATHPLKRRELSTRRETKGYVPHTVG